MEQIDKKWLKYITFWGQINHFCRDFKKITRKLKLWNKYGAFGWNEKNESVCESTTPHKTKNIKIKVRDLPESIYNKYKINKNKLN